MKEKAGPSLRALSRASLRMTSAPRVSIKGGGRENILSFLFLSLIPFHEASEPVILSPEGAKDLLLQFSAPNPA